MSGAPALPVAAVQNGMMIANFFLLPSLEKVSRAAAICATALGSSVYNSVIRPRQNDLQGHHSQDYRGRAAVTQPG
jgi:hypothetical protein